MKQISVVIPNYNGQNLLEKNLPSVISACPQAEIIVVDDASKDDSIKFLRKKYPNIKIISNKTNQRFAISCNKGIKSAKHNIIVLLNNDVSPQKDFLQPLLKHFDNPQVFAVGCLEIQTKDNKQIIYGRNICQFKRGFLIHKRAKNQNKQTTCWIAASSMALDKQKYLDLNGMDSLFSPAYWEDIDLSWRAKQKNWQILFEPKSKVNHNHETTNLQAFGKTKIELMSFRHQILFVWKNIKGLQLIKHFLWLPYHLIFTTIRTKGIFLLALIQAILKINKIKRS